MWSFSWRVHQWKNMQQIWRKKIRRYWHRYVHSRKHACTCLHLSSKFLADSCFSFLLGILPFLHRGMALHNLLTLVQRSFIVIFSQQTTRINNLLPLPNPRPLHKQLTQPSNSGRSRRGLLNSRLLFPPQAPPTKKTKEIPKNNNKLLSFLIVCILTTL